MALAAARTVLGDASELSDIRIEQPLMLDEETPIGAVASLQAPGVLSFAVETINDGKHTRWATAVLRTVEDTDQPPAIEIADLLTTHPRRVDGAVVRHWFERRGVRFGPAFTGLTCVHTAEGTDETMLAEVELPAPAPFAARRLSACTRRCCPPASSRWKPTPAWSRSRTAACCCRGVCVSCVPTDPPAPPATVLRA